MEAAKAMKIFAEEEEKQKEEEKKVIDEVFDLLDKSLDAVEDGLDNLDLAAEKVPEQPEYDRIMSIRSDMKDLAEAIKGMMESLDYLENGTMKYKLYLESRK